MKKGDIVNISTRNGVVEDMIISIGRKYITTKSYKFHADTLREVNGYGISAFIIKDLEKYNKKQIRNKNINKIEMFFRHNTNKLTDEDVDKILELINKYTIK